MNGFPEWTPASKPPKESGRYYVTFQRYYDGKPESFAQSWDFDGSEWDMPTCGTQIIAWTPLPPAYEPPKFGWNPCNKLPKTSGEYLVRDDIHGNDFVCFDATVGAWDDSSCYAERRQARFMWSYIEPTPEAHNET